MTTALDLVEETRSELLSGAREEVNRLTTTVNTSVVSIVVDFAQGGIGRGTVIAIDLELMYVWSFTGSTATVQRGFGGSTPAAHTSGALIFVNPKWSYFRIFQSLNEEIASYSAPSVGLFKVTTVDLTYSPATTGYNLTSATNVLDILKVEATGYLPGDLTEITRWRLARNMVTTDFASGLGIEIYEGANPGKNLRVTYAAPFTALSTLADDVATVAGLHAQAHDIPPLGAAARLLATREARRATMDTQPEPRAAADVPPGAARQGAGGLLALVDRRLKQEATRLNQQYPRRARARVA